ncbi:uncharacterized protein LOC111307987 [Durio zibethinus]|uniref:Uncharacterized protein LOC111307987 n=1 Tax=Durio zibethinus TaxID=66656 RepID=A0A6P6AB15_DURZI|nr:uncharacterized protein LOC111307987 [Durio zibethinus]
MIQFKKKQICTLPKVHCPNSSPLLQMHIQRSCMKGNRKILQNENRYLSRYSTRREKLEMSLVLHSTLNMNYTARSKGTSMLQFPSLSHSSIVLPDSYTEQRRVVSIIATPFFAGVFSNLLAETLEAQKLMLSTDKGHTEKHSIYIFILRLYGFKMTKKRKTQSHEKVLNSEIMYHILSHQIKFEVISYRKLMQILLLNLRDGRLKFTNFNTYSPSFTLSTKLCSFKNKDPQSSMAVSDCVCQIVGWHCLTILVYYFSASSLSLHQTTYSGKREYKFTYVYIRAGITRCANAKNLTLVNQCKETIWPAIITGGGNFHGEGFKLESSQTAFYNAPDGWSGRIWGRTGCSFDQNGNGTCQTGSCGTSLNCTSPGSLPVSLAQFTLGDNIDFYDVSVVDGFNLPIVIKPGDGKGNCSTAGCDGDLRQNCSSNLAVQSNGTVVGCRSACDAFNTDEYCCRGAYEDPAACLPTNYTKSFKQVCPAASSYAYDDRVSIITCSASDYMVAFCATRNNTICTYHDEKLVCISTSEGFKAFFQSWSLMLALPLASILEILL